MTNKTNFPTSSLNDNNPNMNIKFNCNFRDKHCAFKYQYLISWSMIKVVGEYSACSTVKLIDYLFYI